MPSETTSNNGAEVSWSAKGGASGSALACSSGGTNDQQKLRRSCLLVSETTPFGLMKEQLSFVFLSSLSIVLKHFKCSPFLHCMPFSVLSFAALFAYINASSSWLN